jgi:hypothetical protein
MKRKYDSFGHRASDYIQNYTQMVKDHNEFLNNGKPTSDYNSLSQSKGRLKRIFSDHFEGMMSIPESIHLYQYDQKNRIASGLEKAFPQNEHVEDLHLYDENIDDKMREKLFSKAVEFTQENFDELRFKRLFNMVFLYNKLQYKNTLSENDTDYFVSIATLMIKTGIRELKKYMDLEISRLLMEDLDRTVEICNLIKSSKEKQVREWV